MRQFMILGIDDWCMGWRITAGHEWQHGVPRIVIPDFTNREFLRWRWDNYNGI